MNSFLVFNKKILQDEKDEKDEKDEVFWIDSD